MFRILSSCCLVFVLCCVQSSEAASLSELLGLDEALDLPAVSSNVGPVVSSIAPLLKNNAALLSNGGASVLSDGGCVAPIFSSCGSPIIGELGGPSISISISINIDIDVTFVGSCCQPVASASSCF